ncbi:uncharacterized protein LOC107794785 [Nicotiana tabacum]|uniref:Uncharacterized protein LOC107794785 n=1 Tax=Nicotiana tabacum TaxID=4097 RepID=A0A1S4A838_TOBAC|nr:PREDICTED: uncharacterized protein LOC107794785 [Nicotiana tabacum]
MSLLVKNKIDFINETCVREDYEKHPFRLHQWDQCNTIVRSWIMSSVAKELRQGIVFSSNTKKVWEALKNRFDKDEFESIISFPGCDCKKSKTFVEFLHTQKLVKFLMGLNETYAPQRSQILIMHPIPSLNQAYSMLIQEESQRMSSGLDELETHI